MTINYRPRGVCSQQMQIEVEDGVIRSFQVLGGCSGNLQGISRLVEGMNVDEAIAPTSWPRPSSSISRKRKKHRDAMRPGAFCVREPTRSWCPPCRPAPPGRGSGPVRHSAPGR